MRSIWLGVGVVTAATWLLKAAGPLLIGSRRLPPRLLAVTALAAPALLAALLISEVLGEGWGAVDWRLMVGLGGAGLAHALRAPMLVAVLVAIVVTALLRLL